MSFIVLGALLLICVGALWWGARKAQSIAAARTAAGNARGAEDPALAARICKIGAGVFAGGLLLMTVLSMVNQVPVGNAGLIYTFGNITGQTGSGLVWTAPWQTVTTANVKTQRWQTDLDSFSQETQDVFVKATLNYHVNSSDIQRLYRNVGPGWFDVLVPTRVNQAFKDETVKFRAVNIAPNRDVIRKDVLVRLKRELASFSIHVDDLNIDNITFSKAFTTAIEDKQIATQQAAAAQNRVAKAQAEADALIKSAKGIAESNRLKQRTLTPLLVQQNAIDKLNPNVKVIVVPAGGNFLLGNLLSK